MKKDVIEQMKFSLNNINVEKHIFEENIDSSDSLSAGEKMLEVKKDLRNST